MPAIHQLFLMVLNDLLDAVDLFAFESFALLQPRWCQPKLRRLFVVLNVYVWWFVAVASIKEEAIWPDAENRGHDLQSVKQPSPPPGSNCVRRSRSCWRWGRLLDGLKIMPTVLRIGP